MPQFRGRKATSLTSFLFLYPILIATVWRLVVAPRRFLFINQNIMKQYLLKTFLVSLFLITATGASAHDFEVGGIYYNIISSSDLTVEVTYKGSSYNEYSKEYSGELVIPVTVIYNAKTYSVISIGNYAFYNCSGLTNIEIPNSVTTIGEKGFYGCRGLTSVTIGNSVRSIGEEAFLECTGLISIEIPNSVTSIGYGAFNNCRGLTSVTIGNSVTSIGGYAFQGCYGLTSIEIPNSVTSIGNYAFYYCRGLTSIVVDEGNSVYDSREGCNAIIETATNTLIQGSGNTIIPNSVTSIGNRAFKGCSSLKSIEIPNSVTTIGEEAFYACDGLTGVTIGDGVTSIANNTFCNCPSLSIVAIGNGVTSIEYGAFFGCSGLSIVTIGNSVTSIGNRAFKGCSSLTSIEIPNSVTTIGEEAFYDCNGLTKVTIGNGVTSIGNSAFSGCSNLTSVAIPNSVTSIGNSAFSGCNGLTEVTIGNGVTNIDNAFSYCRGLISVTMGNSITSINEYAFHSCFSLTDAYFASNPTISYSYYFSAATHHLTLTDSDAADFNNQNNNTYADVSYTRTISEGKYGTIMLPFAPDEASLQNYAFYTLKEAGDGYIRFEEVAAPAANTPYLYTLRAGGENVAITGGETTIATDINNCNVNGWEFVGSFTNQTIDCTGGNYYAYSAARNEINRITKTLTVSPYRAYLKSSAALNSNLRVFIGGTTGVTEFSPDDIEGFDGGAVYDLYGRPVSEPAKGSVYIINGKKVVL